MRTSNVRRWTVKLLAVGICGTWVLASSPVPAAQDQPKYSAWSEPIWLGDVVNYRGVANWQPYISKDGLSLYFQSGRPGGYGGFDIWVSQRESEDDDWGAPQNLGPSINSPFEDNGPALSPDEHWLYFTSNRPGGHGLHDIYLARRRDRRDDFGWQPAVILSGDVNTSASEVAPAISDDEGVGVIRLYFHSNRLGGADIFASTRLADGTFDTPTLVGPVNTPSNDQAPYVSRDGLEMYLTSNRPGGHGGSDLWMATRASTSDPWSQPVNLGPVVNSTFDDLWPSLSFDGTELYFTSGRLGVPSLNQQLFVCIRTKLRGKGQ